MKKSVLQKIRKYFTISFLFFHPTIWGQNPTSEVRAYSLGNLHAVSSEISNPAMLSFSEQKQIGISVLNQFQMKELNTGTIFLKYPNRRLDLSTQFSTFGYEDYRLTQIQSGFSKKLFPNFSAGINLMYQNETSILEENSQHDLFSDMGIYFHLSDVIDLAFIGKNLLTTQKQMTASGHVGLSYSVSKNAIFFAETSYGSEKIFSFSVGLEYEILEQFLLRSGFQSYSKTPSFGIAYLWKPCTIEAGFTLHPVLGVCSQIGVNLNFR